MSKSLAEKLTERELITVNENDKLLDAINKLVKYNIGAIPVINNNKKLVGIISERDIVKALSNYKNKDYSILLVNQLMTKTVISCEKEVLSDKLMELMTINKIRHIPIVENNAPIGIVSIGDVVNRLIEKVQYENKMLKDFVSGWLALIKSIYKCIRSTLFSNIIYKILKFKIYHSPLNINLVN